VPDVRVHSGRIAPECKEPITSRHTQPPSRESGGVSCRHSHAGENSPLRTMTGRHTLRGMLDTDLQGPARGRRRLVIGPETKSYRVSRSRRVTP